MRRHVSILLSGMILALLAQLTIGATTAFAKTKKCMVINDRINTTYEQAYPESMHPVQTAIDEANPGDTIWIRGYCPGPLEISKPLTLTGQKIKGFYFAPTIDTRLAPSSTTAKKSVVHVSGVNVQVQLNSLILIGAGNFFFPVEKGGGILNEQSELTLNEVTITGNNATFGAGIYNDGGTVEATDSTIDSNIAGRPQNQQLYGKGGGIYTIDGTVILNASTITNNQFAGDGGGIYAISSTVVANGSEIAHNYTVLSDDIVFPSDYDIVFPRRGGGIYVSSFSPEDSSTLILDDTSIHHNGAEYGGGIYATEAYVTVTGNSELHRNHADSFGGGAYVYGNLLLSGDTSIHDNTAVDFENPAWGRGGGVAFSNGISTTYGLTITGNAMIYDNFAQLDGGGIAGYFNPNLINCNAGVEGEEGVNVFSNLPDDINFY